MCLHYLVFKMVSKLSVTGEKKNALLAKALLVVDLSNNLLGHLAKPCWSNLVKNDKIFGVLFCKERLPWQVTPSLNKPPAECNDSYWSS